MSIKQFNDNKVDASDCSMKDIYQLPSISFSVVSHGQGLLIRHLLSDLLCFDNCSSQKIEIILTLNIAEDESFLALFKDLSLKIIRNVTPKGFGANHNAAFIASSGEIFVIINPDIRLTPFDLAPMLTTLERPETGAWAPLVLSVHGNVEDSARKYPTFSLLVNRVILRNRKGDYPTNVGPLIVDWVAGMFLAITRINFLKINGFDERYFMYMEDADICRRLSREGKQIIFDPRVSVIHDAQRASSRSLKYLAWHLRSAIRFLTGI